MRVAILSLACAALAAASPLSSGCSTFADCDEAVCTAELRFYTVTVLDEQRQPADSVNLTVTSRDTGRGFAPRDPMGEGVYVILDDLHELSRSPERVRVEGRKGSASFTADYVFAEDACGCHILKVSGPDTVQLLPSEA